MKRLIGGLIVAGALTVWSTAAVPAEDNEALHGPGAAQATAAINTLQTDPGCNPDLSALAKLSTKNPAKAQELVAGLREQIAQIKADTSEQIVEALWSYQASLREPRDDEDTGSTPVALTVPDFNAMATAACQQITALYNSTSAAITSLPAPTVNKDRDRENDDEDSNDRESVSQHTGERD